MPQILHCDVDVLQLARESGIQPTTCHCLRQAFATEPQLLRKTEKSMTMSDEQQAASIERRAPKHDTESKRETRVCV